MNTINNYDLRKPNKTRIKNKYLILIRYKNDLHQVFIINETEKQLLKRVNSILAHKTKDKILFICIYEIYINDYLQFYGEFNETYKKSIEIIKEQKRWLIKT